MKLSLSLSLLCLIGATAAHAEFGGFGGYPYPPGGGVEVIRQAHEMGYNPPVPRGFGLERLGYPDDPGVDYSHNIGGADRITGAWRRYDDGPRQEHVIDVMAERTDRQYIPETKGPRGVLRLLWEQSWEPYAVEARTGKGRRIYFLFDGEPCYAKYPANLAPRHHCMEKDRVPQTILDQLARDMNENYRGRINEYAKKLEGSRDRASRTWREAIRGRDLLITVFQAWYANHQARRQSVPEPIRRANEQIAAKTRELMKTKKHVPFAAKNVLADEDDTPVPERRNPADFKRHLFNKDDGTGFKTGKSGIYLADGVPYTVDGRGNGWQIFAQKSGKGFILCRDRANCKATRIEGGQLEDVRTALLDHGRDALNREYKKAYDWLEDQE